MRNVSREAEARLRQDFPGRPALGFPALYEISQTELNVLLLATSRKQTHFAVLAEGESTLTQIN